MIFLNSFNFEKIISNIFERFYLYYLNSLQKKYENLNLS